MAAFIFVIGVFNFVLGYLLALALADPPFLGLLSSEMLRSFGQGLRGGLQRPKTVERTEDPATDLLADLAETLPAAPTMATVSELPELWQHALKDDGLNLQTLAAGVAHILRLEGASTLR